MAAMYSVKPTVFFLVLWIAAGLTGCANSAGRIAAAHPGVINQPGSMEHILVATSSHLAAMDREKKVLNDSVISGLRETELFPEVTETGTNHIEAGIKVESDITQIKKVTDNARLWFGGLAGQARIVVQVTVSDLSSGKPVKTFTVEGESGSTARAGTTDEAIQQAAAQITAELVKLNAQTAVPVY
jgi:hypothetical protein